MPNMTIAIPDELHKIMKKHNHVKWSEVARQGIWTYVKKLEIAEKITSNKKFTKRDVEDLNILIKKEIESSTGWLNNLKKTKSKGD